MRVDTTVVETNIHYPTNSSLLGDGVRVLTRVMKKITAIAGEVGATLRDRSRSVKLRVLEIARAARAKGPQSQERLKQGYGRLLDSTSRVVGQAKRFAREIADGVKWARDVVAQLALEGLRQQLDAMAPRVKQVMKQARARIFGGDTRAEGKLLSLFEPSTEVIRKGKAAKPNEFGKMVKLQEAENQIVTDYEVYDRRPNDADLLIPAIESASGPAWTRCRTWWRRMRPFTPARTTLPRRPKASSGFAFPIAPPRAPSANANRKSAGSATGRSGGPDPRGASAWSSADTASTDADTRATTACGVGWARA